MGSGPDTNDHDRRAETWFFEILVRLRQDQTFSDLLNARERDLDGCLASVSVISWACSPTEPETPGTMALEGFVHDGSSNQIRLTSLKRWLPEGKTTDAGIVIKTFFRRLIQAAAIITETVPRSASSSKRRHWNRWKARDCVWIAAGPARSSGKTEIAWLKPGFGMGP